MGHVIVLVLTTPSQPIGCHVGKEKKTNGELQSHQALDRATIELTSRNYGRYEWWMLLNQVESSRAPTQCECECECECWCECVSLSVSVGVSVSVSVSVSVCECECDCDCDGKCASSS